MKQGAESLKGYFINGVGYGGYNGPRRAELSKKALGEMPEGKSCPLYGAASTVIRVVYGRPVVGEFEPPDTVRPVERAFSLLRYSDPSEQREVYVKEHDVHGVSRDTEELGWTPVPTTIRIASLFDEIIPKWHKEEKLYHNRNRDAFVRAMKAAGFSAEDFPMHPGLAGESQELIEEAKRAYKDFLDKVTPFILPPKPLLVRVAVMDDILQEISRQSKRT